MWEKENLLTCIKVTKWKRKEHIPGNLLAEILMWSSGKSDNFNVTTVSECVCICICALLHHNRIKEWFNSYFTLFFIYVRVKLFLFHIMFVALCWDFLTITTKDKWFGKKMKKKTNKPNGKNNINVFFFMHLPRLFYLTTKFFGTGTLRTILAWIKCGCVGVCWLQARLCLTVSRSILVFTPVSKNKNKVKERKAKTLLKRF